MNQKEEILNYYDQLAPEYDQDRFANSYGQYLDQQERALLTKWLSNHPSARNLDLGCGTGRLLDFAANGTDFSKNMLAKAQEKYPDHQLTQSDISTLPFGKSSFDAVYSMHVIMHLDSETIKQALKEVHKVLTKDGIFIFDFPNSRRRKAIRYQKSGWHGNTAMDLDTLEKWAGPQWKLEQSSGFLLFPVHRFPKRLRRFLRPLDSILCRTFLKHFASYYCVYLRKI